MEATVAKIETEQVRSAGQEAGARAHHVQTGARPARRCAEHRRAGTVAEHQRRGEVVRRGIARLKVERGELHRQHEHLVVGERGQMAVRECDRGRSA